MQENGKKETHLFQCVCVYDYVCVCRCLCVQQSSRQCVRMPEKDMRDSCTDSRETDSTRTHTFKIMQILLRKLLRPSLLLPLLACRRPCCRKLESYTRSRRRGRSTQKRTLHPESQNAISNCRTLTIHSAGRSGRIKASGQWEDNNKA